MEADHVNVEHPTEELVTRLGEGGGGDKGASSGDPEGRGGEWRGGGRNEGESDWARVLITHGGRGC